MRFFYTLLFYLALPLLFLRLYWRSRRLPEYRLQWKQRLGYVNFRVNHAIWIHAVSLGETIAAIPLVKALQQTYPSVPIVMTNMTPTGAARVKAVFGETVHQSYVPYDLPRFLLRFVKRINPKVLVVMETELWPNLFAVCREQHVPIIVANARLSERSSKGYARIPSLNRAMFAAIHRLAAQSETDANRFAALGLPREKIVVSGNIKFDLVVPDDLTIKAEQLRHVLGKERSIWIAASTHAGEELLLLAVHRALLQHLPSLLLVLVPRHPDRFDDVASLLQKERLSYARRSLNQTVDATTQVYLGDTLGELMTMYAVADIAFVGGSLVKVGGHNMLEPAALHKPILTGPHLYHFVDISQQLFLAKGMQVVQHPEALQKALLALFNDEDARRRMGENAYNVVAQNRGALQCQLGLVKAMVDL